ncbi:single-stranded DNA-binding protein [Candidatus Nasuia deltocephalinicola]|uniref:single-stranded DNA-binding protein n=1 Tax=Candidatus Nasuia deltocephalincola TaxID=1160784 RepID=UPI00216ADF6F|nr:single-stranded DNA-binding protein [Candidatus Nasuia deltocephalinicola]
MLNKVILIGKIGVEPEIKYFKNSNAITVLKIITTEKINNKKNDNWHRVIINNINKYLKKNMIICIIGKIKTRRWMNSKNEYNYITEIFADEIKIISHDYEKNNNMEKYEDKMEENEENLENSIFENNKIENNKDYENINKNENYEYNYSSSSNEENI